MVTPPSNPNRKLQPVKKEQLLVKLSCGHQVKANNDLFEYIPPNEVPMIKCEQCDREQIEGLPASEIKQHYSNVTGVKDIDDALSDVLGGVPFIMFDRLVYVSIEQSREYNGGF